MCVPYLRGTSEVLTRALKPYGIAVTQKPISTIGQHLPLPKDCRPQQKEKALYILAPTAPTALYILALTATLHMWEKSKISPNVHADKNKM